MKKVSKAAAVAAVMAVLLSACTSLTEGSVDSGEIVVPEMSSKDLLVSSLELILLDEEDGADEVSDPSGTEQDTEQEAGEEVRNENADLQKELERVPKEKEAVIFYGNAGSYDLNQEIIAIEEKTAEELLDALARHNIVSLDTKVLSFEEKETAGEKILHLDLSKAAGEYLKTMSREAECIILASVVNTFLENYEADGVCIAVNGKPLTTKHAEYTDVLKRCTPEELLEKIGRSEGEEKAGQEDARDDAPERHTESDGAEEKEIEMEDTVEPYAGQEEPDTEEDTPAEPAGE